MTSQSESKNMHVNPTPLQVKYFGKIEGEDIAVNKYPPMGEKHVLTITSGGKEDNKYYIWTKGTNTGVVRKKTKTIVVAVTPFGNEVHYTQTLRLQTKEELEEHIKNINKFLAGIGKVPSLEEVKTENDCKKYFIYHLCEQAATIGMVSDETKTTAVSLPNLTTETQIVSNVVSKVDNINIGDYKKNNPPRYKWTKKNEWEKVKQFTENEINAMSRTDHSVVALKDKLLVLKGEMQSGKTLWMITRSLMDVYKNLTSLVVLRETTGDQLQLLQRIRKVNNDFITMASEKFGMDVGNIVEIVDDVHKMAKLPAANIHDIFSGETPKFIACISNESPMNKIVAMLQNVKRPQYALYIDESDYVDMGDSSNSSTGKGKAINVLKKLAYRVTMVSATIIENICNNDVHPRNLFFLRPTHLYKSVRNFTFVASSTKIGFASRTSDDLFQTDPRLGRHMKKLSKMVPYSDSTGRSMPPIHLFNLGSSVAPQKKAQEQVMTRHPNICTIVYNGEGIRFFHKDFVNSAITVNGVKMNKIGPFHEGNVTMADMLGFCEEQGVKKIPQIAIFSGKLAGRGISYVSCKMVNGIGWHVNSLRLARSGSMNNANLLQAIGRLCGNFNDNVPLTCYLDDETCDAAWNAYLFQENLLPAARSIAIDAGDLLKKSLVSMPLSIKQRGDRDISATVKRTTFKKVVPEAKADKWEALEICDKKGKPIVEEKKVEHNNDDSDGIRKLKKSYTNTSGFVYKIIGEFIKHDFSSLTTEQIKKLGNINLTNYDRWDLGKGAKYKILSQLPNKSWILRPEIVDALGLVLD